MSKELVKKQFGANAAHYAVSQVHAAGASLARMVELARPRPDWHALDVATGAGHTAAAFAPHVASIIASDITEEMLSESQKLAVERGLSNMTTARVEAEAMPYPDATFDLVTCRIAPHHFVDVTLFLAETRRVLKPGGMFALVDNVAPDTQTTPGYSADALGAADVVYNLFEKIRDPSHGRSLTPAAWRGLIATAGLMLKHNELMIKEMSFDVWLKNMSVGPEIATRLRTMLVDSEPCLAAYLRPRETQHGLVFAVTEVVLTAIKPG